MQITIDTENLSDLDRQILRVALGEEFDLKGTVVASAAEPKPPAKKAAAKKAAPEPEPEPEPIAEEALPEPDPEPEADEADDQSDEDLLALAVKKATEMVSGGDAAKVREALDAAGASRVRELNVDNVREFFKALG